MQEERDCSEGHGQSGSGNKINESEDEEQTNHRTAEIDRLNSLNVRMQARHHAEDVDRQLNRESAENDCGQKKGVV